MLQSNNGFNPMQWDCDSQGCFNLEKRLKFGVFAECFQGKISFTDVDGIVEVNHNFLLVEWKDHQEIGTGQRILFERLTLSCPATVFIVEGDAKMMSVESMAIVWRGTIRQHQPADINRLRDKIRKWVKWANWNVVRELNRLDESDDNSSLLITELLSEQIATRR